MEIKHDRVRESSPEMANKRIDEKMIGRLKEFAKKRKEDLMKRVEGLDKEWDVERLLEFNASIVGFVGTAAALLFGKRFLILPAVLAGVLMLQALKGWSPPVLLMRLFGIRTQKEIQKERNEMMKLVAAK